MSLFELLLKHILEFVLICTGNAVISKTFIVNAGKKLLP